jgi:hypothetical protein
MWYLLDEVLIRASHHRRAAPMKRMPICREYRKHLVYESWQDGGIDDVAFKEHYDEGYSYAHSCQDTHDKDVFHYIFQKDGSDERGSCGMCGTEFSPDPEDMRVTEDSCKRMPPWFDGQLDIRLAPETRALLKDFRPGRRAALAFLKKYGTEAAREAARDARATGARK